MDFLTLMNETMFPMQEKFPRMVWKVNDNDTVTITIPVGAENASLLRAGQEMFS